MTDLASRLTTAAALCCALALAGCGESAQKLGQAENYSADTRQYHGKPDTRPFEAAPSAYSNGSSWTANDRQSWENALKRRQQSQNEYSRVE